MNYDITIISLAIALLAVFVGPIISFIITKRQIVSSQSIAHRQIVMPMRQEWINNLRKLLAEILSSSLHYFTAGYEERNDKEYERMVELETNIILLLNPNENDNKELLKCINKMVTSLWERGPKQYDEFVPSYENVKRLSLGILKKEWDRIKTGIS